MCEYYGCQALRTIDELTAEHDALVGLAGRAKRQLVAGQYDGVAEACAQMLLILGPHTKVEEDALFSVMAEEFADHIAGLQHDHRVIHAALAAVVARDCAPTRWAEQLGPALHLLREHVLKEQDGLFPAALSTLDREHWDRAEAIRAAQNALAV